jgi:phenylacetate-CoA ligase
MTALSPFWLAEAIAGDPYAGGGPAATAGDGRVAGRARAAGGERGRKAAGLLLRAHEALLGRRTFALADRLMRTQWQAPAWLEAGQLAGLRRLVDHARAECPYYRRLGLSVGRAATLADALARLPLLSRRQLRRHACAMRAAGAPGRILTGYTHGTFDEPLRFYWDRTRQAWDKANRLRGHAWHRLGPGDRELHLWPVDPPRNLGGRLRQRLCERRDELAGEMQIDSLTCLGTRLAQEWARWRTFRPARVTSYPSALAEFIRAGRAAGCRMPPRSPCTIFLTGEVTFDWQRALMERELGAVTRQCYGVQEIGAVAFECRQGRWHLCAESVIVEILRDGRPAAPGELGEIVVTGLASRAMPMIRYCTGDLVRAEPARPCPCGRSLPEMPAVLGRAADFLEAADGRWVPPQEVVAALAGVLDDGSWQVRQDADGGLELQARVPGGRDAAARQEAVRRLEGLMGRPGRCAVQAAAGLGRTAFGKCRYVKSERTTGGLAQIDGAGPGRRWQQDPTIARGRPASRPA